MHNKHVKTLFLRLTKGGTCSNEEFDAIYPKTIRHLSYHYWSTFDLSVKAAIMACHKEKAKVLDIGSGSGKLCLIGSLITNGRFYGIEKRKHLVNVAQKLSSLAPQNHAHFILGDLAEIDWRPFDTIFMFNPLSEYKLAEKQMDQNSQYDLSAYDRYITVVLRKLEQMKSNTRFIAVCESGFTPTASYQKIHCSVVDGLYFGVWQKK